MNQIERLRLRLLLMLGRGRVRFVDDSGPVQTVQVSMQGGDVPDQVPRLAEYGLSSALPADADVVLLKLGGDHSQGVVVASGHQASRPRGLPTGAVVLYDNAGTKVLLNADGTLRAQTAGASVLLTPDSAALTSGAASITLSGGAVSITAPGGLSINGQPYGSHAHRNVQPGTGNSGGVV